MKERLQNIKDEALKAIEAADMPEKLNDVRVKFLGKKGELTAVLKGTNVGQAFTKDIYFWGRPSAADYKADSSAGSNKGPTNEAYPSPSHSAR